MNAKLTARATRLVLIKMIRDYGLELREQAELEVEARNLAWTQLCWTAFRRTAAGRALLKMGAKPNEKMVAPRRRYKFGRHDSDSVTMVLSFKGQELRVDMPLSTKLVETERLFYNLDELASKRSKAIPLGGNDAWVEAWFARHTANHDTAFHEEFGNRMKALFAKAAEEMVNDEKRARGLARRAVNAKPRSAKRRPVLVEA